MEDFIYSFYICTSGKLLIKGMYNIKYYASENECGCVAYKASEIENVKASFITGRHTSVKSGKSWLNNKNVIIRLKKLNFV